MKTKTTPNSSQRRSRRMPSGPEAILARHRAQCRICRHARRDEIEGDFLDWVPAREIAEEYKLGSHRVVYRHAHALELLRMRRGHMERVLDSIIERSGEAKITAASVVAAIRMMVELSWGEKQIHLEIMREGVSRSAAVRSPAAEPDEPDDEEDREEDREEEKRAARNARAAAATARRDDDENDGGEKLTGYAAQLLRELELAHRAEPAPASPVRQPSPAPKIAERNSARMTAAPKESPAKVESPSPAAPPAAVAVPSKPSPPSVPSPAPNSPEPGTRREPDGPPQVAGMAWPWAKGKTPFARRSRWRHRPVVG